MKKKTLWTLLIASAILLVCGMLLYFVTFIPLLMEMRTVSPSETPPSFPVAGFVLTFICILAGNVTELVGRIGALIKQAKQQQWGWFVCTLLLGWVCLLIYLIVWPQPLHPLAAARQSGPQRRERAYRK